MLCIVIFYVATKYRVSTLFIFSILLNRFSIHYQAAYSCFIMAINNENNRIEKNRNASFSAEHLDNTGTLPTLIIEDIWTAILNPGIG